MRLAQQHEPGTGSATDLHLIRCIGPHQINVVSETDEEFIVTVTYPVGSDTVLSIDPGGNWSTKPHGTQGEYERALLEKKRLDRLVYAPNGRDGEAFLLPYTDKIPNV